MENARLKLESAKKSEQTAQQNKKIRQGLIDAVSQACKAYKELDESNTASALSLKKTEEDMDKSQSASIKAEGQRKEAEVLLNLRRADFDYFNNKLHLEQLKERKGRIDRAWQEAALAEELLVKNPIG